MKTLRSPITSILLLFAGFFFAGCYTQLQTADREESSDSQDDDSYVANDSTSGPGGTVADNYFSDDGYRDWRYRMSFGFYPSHRMWASGIGIYPWYDDYYYGDPWDPWYTPGIWYPTLIYPTPYWYHRHGYYPNYDPLYGYGYWGGRRYPAHGGFADGGRRRTTGNTRGGIDGLRVRGGAVSPGVIPVAGGPGSDGLRQRTGVASQPLSPVAPAATAADRNSRRRTREEVPWWERTRTPDQVSADAGKTVQRARAADDPASTTVRSANRQATTNRGTQARVRQNDRRQQQTRTTSAQRGKQRSQPTYGPAQRQETPRVTPPSRESGRSRSSGESGARNTGERSKKEK